MTAKELTYHDLQRELDEIHERLPSFSGDELFVYWFLSAYVTDNDVLAADAICGGSGDKGIDAVLVDTDTKRVIIVQGKKRENLGKTNENHAAVTQFAGIADIVRGSEAGFGDFCRDLRADVLTRLKKARNRILKDKYQTIYYYVTTGKCSKKLAKEAAQRARSTIGRTSLEVVPHQRLLQILDYYLRDIAPPIQSVDLEMGSGDGVRVSGVFHRYDARLDIESWVFSMSGANVADMYTKAGVRLFALNIRGYQGDTAVNEEIEETLQQDPEYFWYYNNGITMVCDGAEKVTTHGTDILRVDHPQVINGQQTTRVLEKADRHKAAKASVAVRVIRIPHTGTAGAGAFDTLVPNIVKASNWQNAISASDLVSNDRKQIELQRQLRKLNYWYVRKRQSKTEAKAMAGSQRYFMINKTELAQAVAGCDMDPFTVRSGKEKLFEEPLYDEVFPNTNPYFYLSRYWLMRCVAMAAKGYPERAYAKWVVLRFLWQRLSSVVASRTIADEFRKECEYDSYTRSYVVEVANAVFTAAIDFYRLNRGKGAKATDVSTFFKRPKRDEEFEAFWKSRHNKRRSMFAQRWNKLERNILG